MTDQELLQQCKDEVARDFKDEVHPNGYADWGEVVKYARLPDWHTEQIEPCDYEELMYNATMLAIQKAREEAAPNITTGQKEILRTAVDKWGNKQIDMVVEECSELIMAICKWKRYPERVQNVVEEIADVQIMLIQATMIFSSTEFVQKVIDSKIERVANRLKN